MAQLQQQIGPFSGRYSPDYDLTFWHDGDPRQQIQTVNLRSVVAIQTSKSLDDISGTFTITLKDHQALGRINEMDVVRIRLYGHDDQGYVTSFRGVVDTVRQGGSADTYASAENTVIEGRCLAKYLQVTSLFLPVWDPQGVLPTALTFGYGDASGKVKSNKPFDIFNYLLRQYTYGQRDLPGISGVPNSRFWLDGTSRFANVADFQVPFLQFDENAMSDALKRLEITGFTEAWVDELGRIVYRHPQWDQPARYRIPTGSLGGWDFQRSDVGVSTYVEVIPVGDPGIDSAAAQALRAGRAPIPSSYLAGGQQNVRPEFVIETDKTGKVTTKGKRNYWYKRQRRLGLRPQQISSPLLATQDQAQAQAEGLLQFYGRNIKTCQLTVPGCPSLRLGENFRVYGELDGDQIDRTYYIDQLTQEYVEGDHYTTSLHGAHGRDPWDPKWGTIAIPKFDPAKLSYQGGVLAPPGAPGGTPGSPVPGGGKVSSTGAFLGGIYTDANWAGQDRGVDFRGSGPMPAFAAGTITNVVARGSGWPLHAEGDRQGALIAMRFDTPVKGPVTGRAYKFMYWAENITPRVKVGDHLNAGDVVAWANGTFAYTEQGFADDAGGNTYANAHGESRNYRGGAGSDMAKWVGH